MKELALGLFKLAILLAPSYLINDKYGWEAGVAVFAILFCLVSALELLHRLDERTQRIANFLDYEFGDGYIDDNDIFHKRGEKPSDVTKETYE